MAPEVLLGGGYTQKADLWSVGVIAFMLLCGEVPFLRSDADFEDQVHVAFNYDVASDVAQ
jgi:serine/threonine protein kinase